MRSFRRTVAALLLCVIGPPAFAWGVEGHHVTALIALHYLHPDVAKKVSDLLAADTDTDIPHDLLGASVWPDVFRAEGHRETASWHFIDVELEQPGVDMMANCPRQTCVIAKIDEFEHQLKDPNVTGEDRVRAVKFLVHFIGDLHQPLHVGEHHDKGGNDVRVQYFGRRERLHAIWDTGIIERIDPNEQTFATKLIGEITPQEIEDYKQGSTIDWANQSFRLAKSIVYADLPAGDPIIIGDEYQKMAAPVVEMQLKRAGIRIATVLNQILGQ